MWIAFARLAVLAALYVGLGAGSCATTSPSATVPIDLPALSANISAPCAAPATLPTADTGRQDVERYWAADRTSLLKCRASQHAAVESYETVRAAFAGAGPKSSLPPATGAGARQRSELLQRR